MTDKRKAGDAASLHSRMMSVRPRKPSTEIQAEHESSTQAYAYACGHRDARHACAEIALEADRALAAVPKVADDVAGLVRWCREVGVPHSKYGQIADMLESMAARVADLEADPARYRYVINALYRGDIDVGEAVIRMRVYGSCPSEEEIDAEVDAAIRQRAATGR